MEEPTDRRRQRQRGHVGLEQYYTHPSYLQHVVRDIFPFFEQTLLTVVASNHTDNRRLLFLDTSAGNGVLETLLLQEQPHGNNWQSLSIDVAPAASHVQTMSFFDLTPQMLPPHDASGLVVGFNPPFGFQGRETIRFMDRAAQLFGPAAMIWILPSTTAKREMPNYTCVARHRLPSNIYYTPAPDTTSRTAQQHRGGSSSNGVKQLGTITWLCVYIRDDILAMVAELVQGNFPAWMVDELPRIRKEDTRVPGCVSACGFLFEPKNWDALVDRYLRNDAHHNQHGPCVFFLCMYAGAMGARSGYLLMPNWKLWKWICPDKPATEQEPIDIIWEEQQQHARPSTYEEALDMIDRNTHYYAAFNTMELLRQLPQLGDLQRHITELIQLCVRKRIFWYNHTNGVPRGFCIACIRQWLGVRDHDALSM